MEQKKIWYKPGVIFSWSRFIDYKNFYFIWCVVKGSYYRETALRRADLLLYNYELFRFQTEAERNI